MHVACASHRLSAHPSLDLECRLRLVDIGTNWPAARSELVVIFAIYNGSRQYGGTTRQYIFSQRLDARIITTDPV
jgi:hypothetical protein